MRIPYPSPASCFPEARLPQHDAGLANSAQERRQPPVKLQRFYRFHLLAIVAWVSSCQCGREEHRPFTPFGVASDLGSPQASLGKLADSGPPPTFTARSAERLDPPRDRFVIGATEWVAPDAGRFAQVLAVDLDHDEKSELVAWVVPATQDPLRPPGSLWLLTETARELRGFPGFVPGAPACSHSVSLEATGPSTMTLDVRAVCPSGGLARAPVRSLSVIAPLRPEPVLLELRLADPVAPEQLTVRVDSNDRDADSRDDARVTFTLSTPDTAPAVAQFAWLERAAGLARDPDEPGASFKALGSLEVVRAKGVNTSRQVAERLNNARRLYAYLCKEGGAFRLTDSNGTALNCGELQSAFDAFVQAEVRAAITQKNFASALFALDRNDWLGRRIPAKLQTQLGAEVKKAIGESKYKAQELPVRLRDAGASPHYSPLTFQGLDLLAMTPDGIRRFRDGVAPDRHEDVSDEVDAWPLLAFGPGGERLLDVSYPCDDARVTLLAQLPDGSFKPTLVTDVLAPRPGNCQGGDAFFHPELRSITWSSQGLTALFGPLRVGPAQGGPRAGSPLSPDGQSAVAVTSLGLFVTSRDSQQLVKTTTDLPDLADCVISNNAVLVACRAGARAFLLRYDP
jgi:hypothetical protein